MIEEILMQLNQLISKLAKKNDKLKAEIEALKSDTIPYKDLHQVVKNVLAQPMRELTDEEILELCPPNHSDMMNEAYTIEFARAIMKRCGIISGTDK